MDDRLICPICLSSYLGISTNRAPGSRCNDASGAQQQPCVGRLIPSNEWENREYPHDQEWSKVIPEMVIRTAQSHPNTKINGGMLTLQIFHAAIRLARSLDHVLGGPQFTKEIGVEIFSEAWDQQHPN